MNLKKLSSIRSKIVLSIVISISLLSFLVYLVSNRLLVKSYEDIEKEQVVQDLNRINDTIDNTTDQLGTKLTDWAWWDDTYQFISDENEEYISSNLGNSSIANLKINTMIFLDNNQNIVYKKLININSQKELPFESIKEHIKNGEKIFLPKDGEIFAKGVILLPEGPMLIASSYILTSDGTGEPRGIILFGRFLDDDLIKDIAELIHLNISMYRYDEVHLPSDVFEVKDNFIKKEESFYVNPSSNSSIFGYSILNDIYGKPALIIKMEKTREIYNQGIKTLISFMILSSITILSFGILIIILFEIFFIYRFTSLSKEVREIGETKNFKARVTEGKRDEIGEFARTINQMLTALSGAIDKEEKFNKEILTSEQKLNDRLQEIEKMNKLMIDRELKMIELKKEIATLKSEKQ